MVTFDNQEEVLKIARHAPHSGLVLRLRVPNTGSVVELSSKFGALAGEAAELIAFAHKHKLVVEGLSFHVGSQCTNPQNFVQALDMAAAVFAEVKANGFELKLLDIGGGFPAHYDDSVPAFRKLAKTITTELDRLFPEPIEILAEPGRFLVASSATAIAKIIGKAVRDGKQCYYLDDGVYHTYSGIIFDHCQYHLKSFKKGATQICSVFGPTCDALDTISLAEQLPDLNLGDLLYSENIGAYSAASSTSLQRLSPSQDRPREPITRQPLPSSARRSPRRARYRSAVAASDVVEILFQPPSICYSCSRAAVFPPHAAPVARGIEQRFLSQNRVSVSLGKQRFSRIKHIFGPCKNYTDTRYGCSYTPLEKL